MNEFTNGPSVTQRPRSRRHRASGRRLCMGIAGLLVASGFRTLGPAEASAPNPQAPIIHCSWALANVGTIDTFEYGPDDNTSTALLESEAACKGTETNVVSQTENAQGLLHLQGNNPKPRAIELWAAVSNPTSDAFGTGEGTVAWIVYKPNGQELARVGQPVRSCAGADEPGPMWKTAATAYSYSGTGAFAAATVSNPSGTGLWQACRQGQIRIFSARTMLPADSPCGTYSVATQATLGAQTTTLTYGIDVLCPVSVLLDTANIHWNVEPGGSAVVQGDADPTTTNSPTITNNGDGPVQVGLAFTPLRRSDMSDAIAEFGAMLVPKSGVVSGLSRLAANTDGWIPGLSSVICPGKSIPINLVVHAPADLAPGEYSGSVRVLARAGGRC
jgi:hypothetical protein